MIIIRIVAWFLNFPYGINGEGITQVKNREKITI